jgi:hypothetical protein
MPVEGGVEGVGLDASGEPVGVRTGIEDATVWRPDPGRTPLRLVGTKDTFGVRIGSDGQRALLRTDAGVGVWDLQTGRRIGRRFPRSGLALWTDDERTIATLAREGIALWDAESGSQRALLAGGEAPWELAFTADGELLVALVVEEVLRVGPGTRTTSSLRVWDVPRRSLLGVQRLADWEYLGRVFALSARSVLAVSGRNGALFLWDLDPDHWAETACRLAGRRLSEAEWERFVGTLGYAPAC